MKRIPFHAVERILIRAPNWIGDAVMSIPAVRALRRSFPGRRIDILTKPWVAPVYEHSPDIDGIVLYEGKGRHSGWAGIWRLSRELRKGPKDRKDQRDRKDFNGPYDLAVLFQNAFEPALLTFLAGIPFRLGYAADGRGLLLTHPIPVTRELKRRHQIDYYLEIIRRAGSGRSMESGADDRLSLYLTPQERAGAVKILQKYGIERGDLIIGVNPGAAFGSAKRWPQERYAELSKELAEDMGARLLIFGGASEKALGDRIAEGAGRGPIKLCGPINLCGSTSLREAIALIDTCSLFITNDSGLMHIAAALGRPQIAIFGPTDWTTTSPAHEKSRMIRQSTVCSPCMKRECPTDHRCMTRITVEQVMAAARNLLAESGIR